MLPVHNGNTRVMVKIFSRFVDAKWTVYGSSGAKGGRFFEVVNLVP